MYADSFTMNQLKDLMTESEKMWILDHPNVMSLIGVCIDAGDTPYIVMPFMANGSLLTYLRKERPYLNVAEEAGDEMVTSMTCIMTVVAVNYFNSCKIQDVQIKLLSICNQIAKGMSYISAQRLVHRDLAARNCMYVVAMIMTTPL